MVHIYLVENFSFRSQACQNFECVRIFQNLWVLHFLGDGWKLQTPAAWRILTLHTEKVRSRETSGGISTHRLTLDEKYLPSPSAAAGLRAAGWKVWRRGAGATKSQPPTSVAGKIYPLENVGYHCGDPPLNGFQLCRNCCQGDWSRCLSCTDHLVGSLTPTGGLARSYRFPHPIYPGSSITNMQSNIQKTWPCPLMTDSQSGPEEPHNQLSKQMQASLPGSGTVGTKRRELFHSLTLPFSAAL